MPLKSLGDKIYKAPDYMPHFYKEGGLIVGSTYSNLKLNVIVIRRKIRQVVMPKPLIFMPAWNWGKAL
jgi:hypothetical protein